MPIFFSQPSAIILKNEGIEHQMEMEHTASIGARNHNHTRHGPGLWSQGDAHSLGMSNSACFYWLSYLEMTEAELRLRREVITIFRENFGYYGHRKITME